MLTCVTALYDIGREAIDGRSILEYTSYLKKTLQSIKVPTIVFLDPTLKLKDAILLIDSSIIVLEIPFEETVMWQYKDRIDTILKTVRHKNPRDITNRISGYCMIQYNKFDFLERAITINPFNSTQFCWIDAGLSRFFDTSKQYTSRNIYSAKFHVQTSYSTIPQLLPDTYIGTNTCILKGGCWYMDTTSFRLVRDEVMRIWNKEMMSMGRIDNEQIALAVAYQKIPDIFQLCVSDDQIGKIFSEIFITI